MYETRFNPAIFDKAIGDMYHMFTIPRLCPSQVGWPGTRRRRFTLMVHKSNAALTRTWSASVFSRFHKTLTLSCDDVCCAPQEMVQKDWKRKARRDVVEHNCDSMDPNAQTAILPVGPKRRLKLFQDFGRWGLTDRFQTDIVRLPHTHWTVSDRELRERERELTERVRQTEG